MARTKYKSGIVIFLCLLYLDLVKLLPIIRSPVLETTDNIYTSTSFYQDEVLSEESSKNSLLDEDQILSGVTNNTIRNVETRIQSRQNFRPGQTILKYTVQITRNGNSFAGRVLMDVRITDETREDPIALNIEDLNIQSVSVGVLTASNLVNTPFSIDDGRLEISPIQLASAYQVLVEYTANFRNDGIGLYIGQLNEM